MIPLLVYGLNYETAPLELRERVAFPAESIVSASSHLSNALGLGEVAILSTCNRTELITVEKERLSMDAITAWLADFHGLPGEQLHGYSYLHRGEEALKHVMAVACGLDSMVMGEPQILGQLKSSYKVADEASFVQSELHSVFQAVFRTAKLVRSETAIGQNPVSVAYAAVSLAERIFSDVHNNTAMLIGAGETIELVARYLKAKDIRKLIIANRTLERAQRLSSDYAAQSILLADIPEHLHNADIIISSTASQLPILGKGAVESALKRRKHKPMFMVDIAVPRDIEPEVNELSDVYLFTIDDLKNVIDENKQSREAAAKEAVQLITQQAQDFVKKYRYRQSIAVIRSYREHAEAIKQEALRVALKELQRGTDPERVMIQLANQLTNKLLHNPTKQLKQAQQYGHEDMLDVSQQLLGYVSDNNSQTKP